MKTCYHAVWPSLTILVKKTVDRCGAATLYSEQRKLHKVSALLHDNSTATGMHVNLNIYQARILQQNETIGTWQQLAILPLWAHSCFHSMSPPSLIKSCKTTSTYKKRQNQLEWTTVLMLLQEHTTTHTLLMRCQVGEEITTHHFGNLICYCSHYHRAR